jgi:hypothetical protein
MKSIVKLIFSIIYTLELTFTIMSYMPEISSKPVHWIYWIMIVVHTIILCIVFYEEDK